MSNYKKWRISKTPATVGFAKTTHNDETLAPIDFRHFE